MTRGDIIRMAREAEYGEAMSDLPPLAVTTTMRTGYWCVICGRLLPADEDGVIVHDPVPHPEDMTFDEDKRPQ